MVGEKLIPVATRAEVTAVKRDDILCVESRHRVLIIHTAEREYCYYGKLIDLLPKLGDSFYKCHISCVINMAKIASIRNNAVHFVNGKAMLFGKNVFQAIKKNYLKYIERQWTED